MHGVISLPHATSYDKKQYIENNKFHSILFPHGTLSASTKAFAPGSIAQSVGSLNADPGVASLIYFCGDWLWNNFYGHSPPADSRTFFVSYQWKYVHEVLIYHLVKLAQEKVRLGELPSQNDHSCWLGRKTSIFLHVFVYTWYCI